MKSQIERVRGTRDFTLRKSRMLGYAQLLGIGKISKVLNICSKTPSIMKAKSKLNLCRKKDFASSNSMISHHL
jgi:hypothetical protein